MAKSAKYTDVEIASDNDPSNLGSDAWDLIQGVLDVPGSSVEILEKGGKIARRQWLSPPAASDDVVLSLGASEHDALTALKDALGKADTISVNILDQNGHIVIRRWLSSYYVEGEHTEI